MNQDVKIFEALITEGIIGPSLANIIKGETNAGKIANAVILATYKASQRAEKSNLPLIKVDKNRLFISNPNGTKKYLKLLPAKCKNVPSKFTLT